ncbi:hypothetical protein [Egicoccus sp. AB-alg2]|uniref:hypothetical protein n=1 Tax=Egicoccus sp. AB-alg2 TaxID=3242693 RepID=UPI00359D622C
MPEIQIPVDLGFTEFVTSLLSEVMNSIVVAQSEQEEKLAELAAVAASDPDDYADHRLDDAAVDAFLTRLFPPTADDRPHDAVRGAPYAPAGEDGPESPPYQDTLDVALGGGDFNPELGHLLLRGVRKIRAAARRRLAEQELAVARHLTERGVPRVLVDAGRIRAKLTFEALQYRDADTVEEAEEADEGGGPVDDATEPAMASTSASSLLKRQVLLAGRLPGLHQTSVVPQVLRDVRLRVHSADERDPGTGSTRANVYGEVELTFKTVP